MKELNKTSLGEKKVKISESAKVNKECSIFENIKNNEGNMNKFKNYATDMKANEN